VRDDEDNRQQPEQRRHEPDHAIDDKDQNLHGAKAPPPSPCLTRCSASASPAHPRSGRSARR
jgi:hypothetical protein